MALLQDAKQTDPLLDDAVSFPESRTAEEIARRLLYQCPSLSPLVARLALAAEHDVIVLLTGETGSGKTSLARLIHASSPRRREPFLAVAVRRSRPPPVRERANQSANQFRFDRDL